MAFESPEQLLTPENSRSETSSNNEHASLDEKPTPRRSTRVTRPSLRAKELLDDPKTTIGQATATMSEKWGSNNGYGVETPVDGAPSGRMVSHSYSLRSISTAAAAVAVGLSESTERGSETMHVPQDGHHHLAHYEPLITPHTPVSKDSQEPQQHDHGHSNTHMSQTLRELMENVLAEKDDNGSEPEKTSDADSRKPSIRRSTRLSSCHKAMEHVDSSGKRPLSTIEKGKEKETGSNRRASLRPRKPVAASSDEQVATAPSEPPMAKKRRVSGSNSPLRTTEKKKEAEEEEDAVTKESSPSRNPVVPKNRRKLWLSHGLYSGQERTTETRPIQNRKRNSRSKRLIPGQRRLLPMPMFAGGRLLVNGRDFQLPFDIFSPLPPGQPKPNEWRKTNKNVFVGEAGSIWRAYKHMELSSCTCTEDTGCDENCQNRYMFYECDDGNCRLGPECGNRSFEELKQRTKAGGKYNIGVEVIKTPDRGYGVRSNRTFEPNQIIVEYTGEIITQDECERRMRKDYKNNDCYYLMYFDQNMIIDATRGSIARFVNHSCEPNCRMEKWTVAGKPRMALFAGSRGIMTGEELSYDYNFDPYSQKNVQECRCGSSSCRGVLGPRPKDKEKRLKRLKTDGENDSNRSTKKETPEVAGRKRRNDTPLDESTSRLNKKQKLPAQRSATAAGGGKAVSNTNNLPAPKSKADGPKKRGRPTKAEVASRTGRAAKYAAKSTKSDRVTRTGKATKIEKHTRSTRVSKAAKATKATTKTTKDTKVEKVSKTAKSQKTTSPTTKSAPKSTQTRKKTPKQRNIKLPTVDKKPKTKAPTTRRGRKPAESTADKNRASSPPAEKPVSKLQRPSAKAKAKILDAAKQTNGQRQKRTTTKTKENEQTEKKKVGRKPAGNRGRGKGKRATTTTTTTTTTITAKPKAKPEVTGEKRKRGRPAKVRPDTVKRD